MTRLAERHEVVFVICAAMRERQDVVHLGRFGETSRSPAHLAERMRGEEQSADPAPAIAVALLVLLRPSITLVLLRGQPLVLQAVTLISFYESGATRITAWLLRFVRQQNHLHDVSCFVFSLYVVN